MTRLGKRILLAGAVGALAVTLLLHRSGASPLVAALLGLNLVTVLAYGFDKHQARRGDERVPELALHLLALAGGSPGALAAQHLFRHKTRDRAFRGVFFAILAVQCLLLLTTCYAARR